MIHYTCDRCKRSINPETETRYVVEIDVRMANVAEPQEDRGDDLDQLAELHDQLQREVNAEIGVSIESTFEEIDEAVVCCDIDEGPEQYDLCEHCHEVFVNNPLGRETTLDFGFSNN